MDSVSLTAVDEMDAARAALKQTTAGVLDAICAVLAGLYPEGKYFAVNNWTIYDANGRVTRGPRNRRGDIRYPRHLVGDWPLDRLPKRITRPHLGKHADSRTRTLNDLLRQARRAGGVIPYGVAGRHYQQRLTLR
ncbi:hypothetical protein ABZS96_33740 [Streptomyces avermitilis]|uniref:hypothetical protein n=1 Tax=Streptomyces avermitilis TaxID=33903 RepID=UPI0033B7F204